MANTVLLVLLPLLLLPFSSLALTQDFCVADLNDSDTPAGYPCKPQASVTAGDFFYGGLATAGSLQTPYTYALGTAFVANFTGLDGLGISATRVDIPPGGAVPLHTHPEGSELLIVTEGSMVAGFISAGANTVYTKTVRKGELFVFPKDLLHFQYNTGKTTAVGIAAYSSADPGAQIVDNTLFASDLSSADVEKTTYLSDAEVRRLKELFRGSG